MEFFKKQKEKPISEARLDALEEQFHTLMDELVAINTRLRGMKGGRPKNVEENGTKQVDINGIRHMYDPKTNKLMAI